MALGLDRDFCECQFEIINLVKSGAVVWCGVVWWVLLPGIGFNWSINSSNDRTNKYNPSPAKISVTSSWRSQHDRRPHLPHLPTPNSLLASVASPKLWNIWEVTVSAAVK